MKNTIKILTGSVLTLALLVGTVSVASAYQGNPSEQGPNFTTERHAEMTAVFESGDFASFEALMAKNHNQGRVMQKVTAENFDTFVKAHNLALNGDLEGAKALRAEMGLGLQNGNGQKNIPGQLKGNYGGNLENCMTQ